MDLKIYTDKVEESAHRQIMQLLAQKPFANAKVRIMPDVHAGKGCVIGFTADLGDKVIPNIVGVDIGCGMLTLDLGTQKPDLAEIDAVMHSDIPSGMSGYAKPAEDFPELEALHCFPQLRNLNHLRCSLGTLGGGNHFVEVDADSHGHYYLIIHSGSRNLGKQVCEIYQNEAITRCSAGINRAEKEAEIVETLKAQGRHREIHDTIQRMREEWDALYPFIPRDLSYLEGESRARYLDDMRICQKYALRNREVMAETIVRKLGLQVHSQFHTTHNYIDHESNIVRKGAISARKGERLLIPINMRDGCIYGVGKGNDDWNCSAPHGAGRLMSRSQALKSLSLTQFEQTMTGIYSTCITQGTLDESPMAYKGMDDILKHISPTVDVVDIFRPIYNFKAEED